MPDDDDDLFVLTAFICCPPYEEDSLAAGFNLGRLSAALDAMPPQGKHIHLLQKQLVAQADLLAMGVGAYLTVLHTDDNFALVEAWRT